MSEQSCECAGACEGTQPLTPVVIVNRPALPALAYRVGTHARFFESMQAQLSRQSVDVPNPDDPEHPTQVYPLQHLATRAADDPAIALLDGWATVADVLTFYQERLANEGYLRTATERRSVLELARLIGYVPRPGVAASVFLAYTLDDQQTTPVEIPIGARAQSVPGPGELPQSFETSDELEARAAWNFLKPRLTRPQTKTSSLSPNPARVYLQGISTQLKANDALLVDWGDGQTPLPYRVQTVEAQAAANRTLVTLSDWSAAGTAMRRQLAPDANPAAAEAPAGGPPVSGTLTPRAFSSKNDPLIGVMQKLALPPSVPPRNTLNLGRNLAAAFTNNADLGPQLVATFLPALRGTFDAALANGQVTANNPVRVYALRVQAAPFGNSAPRQVVIPATGGGTTSSVEWKIADMTLEEQESVIHLDGTYDKIRPGSWVIVDTSAVDWAHQTHIERVAELVITQADQVQPALGRAAYGISGKSTQLTLTSPWFKYVQPQVGGEILLMAVNTPDLSFQLIRRSVVYAQSEELPLAPETIDADICGGGLNWIELDGLYSDLKSGRWLVVSGERADVTAPDPNGAGAAVIRGVPGAELVMLGNVVQDVALTNGMPQGQADPQFDTEPMLPGETLHTFIQLAKPLQYCYRRDNLKIYANVVKATHGETRAEILGNGDGSRALQSFDLKQPPLTYVSAANPAGADSTLQVYVNEVEWHEASALAGLPPADRRFITRTSDEGVTSVIFGNGRQGARLPTGAANVRAVYRQGIGQPGNVQAEQISQLSTRPLGVKGVINPLRASGGADKESRDQLRRNAPLAVTALDRLVSVPDYADFARTFAGIAKAASQQLSDGRRELVHVTIAGQDDIAIDPVSDLYRNLVAALRAYGDPDLPVQVDVRELELLVISAKVSLQADYVWETVVSAVRARLLDTFSFDRRELAQDAILSEAVAAMQAVPGVDYVDVDAFGVIPEKTVDPATGALRPLTPAEIVAAAQRLALPDTTISLANRLPQPYGRVRVRPAYAQSNGLIRPAQLAYLSPQVPDTLILNRG
jgi:hypothetical protein